MDNLDHEDVLFVINILDFVYVGEMVVDRQQWIVLLYRIREQLQF
jgi:hypothetical protein